VVGGDGLSFSIAAASVVAKVTRESLRHAMNTIGTTFSTEAGRR